MEKREERDKEGQRKRERGRTKNKEKERQRESMSSLYVVYLSLSLSLFFSVSLSLSLSLYVSLSLSLSLPPVSQRCSVAFERAPNPISLTSPRTKHRRRQERATHKFTPPPSSMSSKQEQTHPNLYPLIRDAQGTLCGGGGLQVGWVWSLLTLSAAPRTIEADWNSKSESPKLRGYFPVCQPRVSNFRNSEILGIILGTLLQNFLE